MEMRNRRKMCAPSDRYGKDEERGVDSLRSPFSGSTSSRSPFTVEDDNGFDGLSKRNSGEVGQCRSTGKVGEIVKGLDRGGRGRKHFCRQAFEMFSVVHFIKLCTGKWEYSLGISRGRWGRGGGDSSDVRVCCGGEFVNEIRLG